MSTNLFKLGRKKWCVITNIFVLIGEKMETISSKL